MRGSHMELELVCCSWRGRNLSCYRRGGAWGLGVYAFFGLFCIPISINIISLRKCQLLILSINFLINAKGPSQATRIHLGHKGCTNSQCSQAASPALGACLTGPGRTADISGHLQAA